VFWAIVFFGQFLKSTKLAQIVGHLFSTEKSALIFTKNELGRIFGYFFTNPCGHTEQGLAQNAEPSTYFHGSNEFKLFLGVERKRPLKRIAIT
jgi:hypothetical protein